MIFLAMAIDRSSRFDVPFRGSFLLVLSGAALCVLCGIGIGTVIATFTRSAQQAQLTSFFVNPPLASLSGALTPVEAMPHWLQPDHAVEPDPPFRRHCPGGAVERQRDRIALAEFSRFAGIYADSGES